MWQLLFYCFYTVVLCMCYVSCCKTCKLYTNKMKNFIYIELVKFYQIIAAVFLCSSHLHPVASSLCICICLCARIVLFPTELLFFSSRPFHDKNLNDARDRHSQQHP